MRGIAEHPADAGLLDLVERRCREPLPEAAIAPLIEALATALPPDRFARASEALWRRLLERGPFTEFRALHARLVRGARGAATHGLVVLRFMLLRFALFRGDAPWIADEIAWMLDHQAHIRDLDLDLVDAVRDYRWVQPAPPDAGGSTLRAQIEAVARAACEADEVEAEQRFRELQDRIVEEPELLIATFAHDDPAAAPIAALLAAIARHLELAPHPVAALDPAALRLRVYELLQQLAWRCWRDPPSALWRIFTMTYQTIAFVLMIGITLALVVPFSLLFRDSALQRILPIALLGLIAGLGWGAKRFFLDTVWLRWRRRQILRVYARIARLEILRFLRSHATSFERLEQVIREIQARIVQSEVPRSIDFVTAGLRADAVPLLYAILVQCR